MADPSYSSPAFKTLRPQTPLALAPFPRQTNTHEAIRGKHE